MLLNILLYKFVRVYKKVSLTFEKKLQILFIALQETIITIRQWISLLSSKRSVGISHQSEFPKERAEMSEDFWSTFLCQNINEVLSS